MVIKSLRKARQTHGRKTWLPTARSVASYFDDFTTNAQNEIDGAGDKSDREANKRDQTEVLSAKATLKRKAASSEQASVPQNTAKRSNRKSPKVRHGLRY